MNDNPKFNELLKREVTLPRATWDKLDQLALQEGITPDELAAGAILSWIDVFTEGENSEQIPPERRGAP